ncbi:DNA polymerase III subunit gamma/tau [Xylella fastidiosa subsp. fastidiosa]|jgi:DNA polymerase-3 subunit gamma/tau|uniref:DNA polymerase III subunit gamma/tau n=3 Tax=Xylella fastidiosa TaxID=2371 RepID=Q87CK6_XYLFT|nr:DNA polymerase III subunit gamma/tau [Xylella fastidiosa]ADN64070.1 DNA polymerase III subunits gamma and tau [Xylella fastidiosa subsp. fastidiosa GB514]KAF0570358.1 DNA polymerase III subunit gamma/tau [Xylella fastidiosa subsp. fastidiosa Mus-1]AAO28919.1 DNA polymerase III subunits gamma and tau [Xylella fastidiosa Temecula1]ACB92551.1 DNA polymerase III, subunits gamma and tau [Xylella fastidiosa M23]EGO81903.1 DNA polymerase III, gamma/tau subunit [Xylella fastidiosa EB92.1]
MSYLVLARKWRPKRFAELVGQEHVVRALSNALESGRLHHAFLFTGTRGVGKTTIARIFAKSLNCEQGTSADPCGRCTACLDIDVGRYIDLLEIDAASNTGVDDVREMIENAQYMPSRGKFKVYLIDEVHMLSKAAFNALLKTLEEPPPHVKFLLATTDPQKLPVTVLSRCLQFNLKRLDEEQIQRQIAKILTAEQITADDTAIIELSKAADGSLRDGLSLLDQAIAYAGGTLREGAVRDMLGTVDRTQVEVMLAALIAGDGDRLLRVIATLAEFSPDWGGVLEALAEALHRIQVQQLVPSVVFAGDGLNVALLAEQTQPEVVQLWYQMAINGRHDLHLAPSPRVGFEMAVLRMLAFRPVPVVVPGMVSTEGQGQSVNAPLMASVGRNAHGANGYTMSQSRSDLQKVRVGSLDGKITDVGQWLALVERIELSGPSKQLAAHAAFVSHENNVLSLALAPEFEYLQSTRSVADLTQGLTRLLGQAPEVKIEARNIQVETLHERTYRQKSERQQLAEEAFMSDHVVQHLIYQQAAKVVTDSIRPYDE